MRHDSYSASLLGAAAASHRAGGLLFAAALALVGCSSDDGNPAPGSAGTASGGSGGTQGASGEGGSSGAPAASAAGCTRTEGGTAITSLCAAAPLNALTAAEALQLCTDTGSYVMSSINRATGCKYAAIVAAASNSSPTEEQLQAACSNTENACNQDATVAGPGAGTQCSQIPATCTATVEQYTTCVMGEAALFDQGASALVSCNMLTFGNLSTVYDVPTAAAMAPSCAELKTACPNFSLPYIN